MNKHYSNDHLFQLDFDRRRPILRISWRMAFIIVATTVTCGLSARAQTTEKPKPVTREEAQGNRVGADRLYWGYQTSTPGWVIRNGDTLQLGRGSLPNKEFAFLYENPNSITASVNSSYRIIHKPLPSMYSGKTVILKELSTNGSKRTGFGIYGLAGVGLPVRYYIELDNAIEAGEILPPIKYRPSAQSSPALPVSVADELIKLKSLLDAGAITQEEFDVQKKKLLNR